MGLASLVHWRRRRLERRRPWPGWRLLAAVSAPLAAFALAPVALARPAVASPPLSVGAGLLASALPSVLPTVCVGGILLCPGSVVTLPTPTPVPVPTVCLAGAACNGNVVTAASPTAVPSTADIPGQTRSGAGASTAPVALRPLPAPPGVGIVPQPQGPAPEAGLSPDSFANLLSLSLRDGLGSARYHVWPWLLGIQLVLWAAIAIVGGVRHLTSRVGRRPR